MQRLKASKVSSPVSQVIQYVRLGGKNSTLGRACMISIVSIHRLSDASSISSIPLMGKTRGGFFAFACVLSGGDDGFLTPETRLSKCQKYFPSLRKSVRGKDKNKRETAKVSLSLFPLDTYFPKHRPSYFFRADVRAFRSNHPFSRSSQSSSPSTTKVLLQLAPVTAVTSLYLHR